MASWGGIRGTMETGGEGKGKGPISPPFSQIIWFTQLPPFYQKKSNALSIYLFIYAKMKQ
jgi:hypothetical protein